MKQAQTEATLIPGEAVRASVPARHAPLRLSDPASAGVRVLCVDDHAVLVEGLRAQFALDGAIQIAGRLPTAERLIEEVASLRPDVVLLDIEMPGPDVFEIADRLRHMHPGLRFVFLSAHVRDAYLAAAFKCGAWGYFAKSDEPEEIAAGIKEVARSTSGTFVMGAKVRQHCVQPSHGAGPPVMREDPQPHTPIEALTSREMEVLRLIGKGLSRVEIGKEMSRSAKTIDGHQERMIKKLGVRSRADLMRLAIREGFAEA